MARYFKFNQNTTDTAGNLVQSTVTVTNAVDGSPAVIWSDEGFTLKPSSFVATGGLAEFFALAGTYLVNINDGRRSQTYQYDFGAEPDTFVNRAAFEAATIADSVDTWSVLSDVIPSANLKVLHYVRDPNGTAIESANGVKGSPAGVANPEHWGAVGDGATDDSAAIQGALTFADEVVLLDKTYIGQELVLKNYQDLHGTSKRATLKLANGANTFLIATSSWATNQTSTNLYITIKDLTLDGNKANNPSGTLAHFCCYRMSVSGVQINNSGSHGIEHTAVMRDGTTLNANGFAECSYTKNHFNNNVGAGFYARDGGANIVSDYVVAENDFNGNGARNGAQIYSERTAGCKIVNNQLYSGGFHDMYLVALNRTVVSGNHCDVAGNLAESGDRPSCIWVQSWSADGGSVITGNVLRISQLADTATADHKCLSIATQAVAGAAMIGANSFHDDSPDSLGEAYYFGFTLNLTNLAESRWIPDALNTSINVTTPPPSNWYSYSAPYVRQTTTPTVAFQTNGDFTPTYNSQICDWYRVGPLVYFSLRVSFNTNGFTGTSGEFRISGLPHPVYAGGPANTPVFAVGMQNVVFPTAPAHLSANCTVGEDYLAIKIQNSGGSISNITATHVPASTTFVEFRISGTYLTDA